MKCRLLSLLKYFAFSGTMLALMLIRPFPATAQSADLDRRISAFVDQSYGKLFALYKDLHAHPEIAFQEKIPRLGLPVS